MAESGGEDTERLYFTGLNVFWLEEERGQQWSIREPDTYPLSLIQHHSIQYLREHPQGKWSTELVNTNSPVQLVELSTLNEGKLQGIILLTSDTSQAIMHIGKNLQGSEQSKKDALLLAQLNTAASKTTFLQIPQIIDQFDIQLPEIRQETHAVVMEYIQGGREISCARSTTFPYSHFVINHLPMRVEQHQLHEGYELRARTELPFEETVEHIAAAKTAVFLTFGKPALLGEINAGDHLIRKHKDNPQPEWFLITVRGGLSPKESSPGKVMLDLLTHHEMGFHPDSGIHGQEEVYPFLYMPQHTLSGIKQAYDELNHSDEFIPAINEAINLLDSGYWEDQHFSGLHDEETVKARLIESLKTHQ